MGERAGRERSRERETGGSKEGGRERVVCSCPLRESDRMTET